MLVPLENGILEFRWIEFILAQMCLLTSSWKDSNYSWSALTHLSSIMYFLGIFAGQWPSRNERYDFSHKLDFDRPFGRYYMQVHFRCFAPVTSLKASPDTEGLRNTSGQGHSTVNFPVRNEGGKSARLLIYTITPI